MRHFAIPFRYLFIASAQWLLLLVAGCATIASKPERQSIQDADNYGVLLMAHGGQPTWNAGVVFAVAPLQQQEKVEIAFGMADANSIQKAVSKLEKRGVNRIGVIRLFISGESWRDRTAQILGLRAGAPARPAMTAAHKGHAMGFWKIDTKASFALSQQGLSEASAMDAILVERATSLSDDPAREDVLILAHGPGDDDENERWLVNITARTGQLKASIPFRRIKVMTLREDWHEKRKTAEANIRAFVKRAKDEGGTAIVIPFRTHGFGPYAKVLDGLPYRADGKGLIPHKNVSLWIKAQSDRLKTGQFTTPPQTMP